LWGFSLDAKALGNADAVLLSASGISESSKIGEMTNRSEEVL
jgi:hypothetical protein